MKTKRIYLLLSATAVITLAGCSHDRSMEGRYDPNDPGYEYAPEGDMYHAVPYEPLSQYQDNESLKNFESGSNPYNRDSMNMRMPVKGTVARDQASYYFPFKNTPEDYNRSGEYRNTTVGNDAKTLADGRQYYEVYCWQCHGSEASPKGSLVEAGVYPPPTWDFERKALLNTLPEGRMFFSITYGRNLMGPHGSIVQPDQRWKIIRYLKSIAAGGSAPAPASAPADSASTASNNTATTTH